MDKLTGGMLYALMEVVRIQSIRNHRSEMMGNDLEALMFDHINYPGQLVLLSRFPNIR